MAPAITFAVAGLTVTEPTGTATMFIVALPVFPSLVAIIAVEPTPVAVTSPVEDTVAIAVLPVLHVTTRPVRTVWFKSYVVAVACAVWPTWMLEAKGDTLTESTGIGVTVIEDVPPLPSLVAVITATPLATAVTNPADETVARVGSLDDHVTTRPDNTLPLTSFVVAVNW